MAFRDAQVRRAIEKQIDAAKRVANMPRKLTSEVVIGASDGRTAEQNVQIAQIQARRGRNPFYLSADEREVGKRFSVRAWAAFVKGKLDACIKAMDDHAAFVVKRIFEHFARSLSRTDVPMRDIKASTVKQKRRERYLYPRKPLMATLQLRNSIRAMSTRTFS